MIPPRTQVLWFGKEPDSFTQNEFEHRDLLLNITPSDELENLVPSCAAVFQYDSENKSNFLGIIQNSRLTEMINHGLLIVFNCQDQNFIRLIQSKIPRDIASDQNIVFTESMAAHKIAELIRRWNPEMPYSKDLKILGSSPSDFAELLLRRAFSDCVAITLQQLHGGLSGSAVYAVYAEFRPDINAGPYPLPFFAKIDKKPRVEQELAAYDRFVSNFIPFSQRPNLDKQRCLFSAMHGVLIGDFVDNAVPLTNIVHTSARRSVIYSLFDDALRGWRRQGFLGSVSTLPESLLDCMQIDLNTNHIHKAVLEAASRIGPIITPEKLVKRLKNESIMEYRLGPIHGDLNTENVFARNGEAILIDFYKANRGPLVADLASLEVTSIFRSTIRHVPSNEAHIANFLDEWRSVILEIYCSECLFNVPPPHNEPTQFAWLWDVCRELRLLARAIEPNCYQYLYCLVAYLVRESSFFDEKDKQASISVEIAGKGYYIACRILNELAEKNGQQNAR